MLKPMRQAAGLTQTQLAAAAGISQSYLARLELGRCRSPGLAALNALCEALSLTPEERTELILHFADRQGAAVAPGEGTAGTGQMLPADVGEEAA